MSYLLLGQAIREVIRFLENKNLDYSLIGGLAVSFRTIERATKDIDFIVAVSSQADVEKVIRMFLEIGFSVETLMEKKETKEIATVRLLNPKFPNVYLDLLFNATGIEKEIVETSELVSILPDVEVNIASISALIAMKVLSSDKDKRLQDIIDLQHLINEASDRELEQADSYVKLIMQRKYNAGQDLQEKFNDFKQRFLL